MTNAIRLAAVTAFAMTLAAGCGGKTACDEFADYVVDECGLDLGGAEEGEGAEIECDDGTAAACTSECGLAADCIVFVPPEDLLDEAYLDASAAYVECLGSC